MPAARLPLVAVTATTKIIDGLSRVRLNDAYVKAIATAGLVPLIVPPLDPAMAGRVLDGVAGLVLTGGEDVDPVHFGATPHPQLGPVHAERDAFELALVEAARERRTPTLAICRGIQLLNVALGGTLIQDIPSERPSEVGHDESERRTERLHDVLVDQDTRLAAALGANRPTIRANSSHHQSVDRPADSLRVVAHAPDGIIEGVETTSDDWWVLGVQWHPEELVETPEPWDRGLFAAFAEQVQKRD